MIRRRVFGLSVVSSLLLSVIASAQTLKFTPLSLHFSSVYVNASTVKTIVVKNISTSAVTISSIAVGLADYGVTHNCPISPMKLGAGASCTMTVTFAPQALGLRSTSLIVTSDAIGSPHSVPLSGTGIAATALSTTSLLFGQQLIATSSAAKTVTLTNNSPVAVQVSAVMTSNDFPISSDLCTGTLAPGSNCVVSVAFRPSLLGKELGTLTFNYNPPSTPQVVRLSGSGIKAGIISILVSPTAPHVAAGFTQQFLAVGHLTGGGTVDLTSVATWSSSNTASATIKAGGLATTLAAGSTTIQAALASLHGSSVLTVDAPVLVSIYVSPLLATVAQGLPQSYTATGTFSDQSTHVLSSANWSSSNLAVATVSNAGVASTFSPGSTTISASVGSISGSATLNVTAPALTSLAVAPGGTVFVGVGSTKQYTASGTFTDGTIRDLTRSVTWASSDDGLATIDGYGLATSTGGGAATITATSGAVSDSAQLSGVAGGFVSCDSRLVDMKVLVVTSGGSEPDYPAIIQGLSYLGTPYTVFDTSAEGAEITSDFLFSGCHGFFQGVIFTIAGYRYGITGISNLDSYEHNFQVRHLNWFAFPGTDFGLNPATGTIPAVPPTPYVAHYTADAAPVFPYANTGNPLTINFSTIYLSTAFNGATPLLTDDAGNALAVIYNTPWGSYQQLTLTFDSNPFLTHNLVLAYGLVNWVTQGIYLGERHAYFTPQVDDMFIDDAEWSPGLPCNTPSDNTGTNIRINAADLGQVLNWQAARQAEATSPSFALTLAFNGFGTTPGAYDPDDLTPAAQANQAAFLWVNHTFDHKNLDNVSYSVAANQIIQNNNTALTLGLTLYDPKNMVTPDISGLTNPAFLQAAVDNGVTYLVTDTSQPGYDNPTPNTGIVNPIQPSILMIPRHPNNLFFNVATPDDWVAEYACIYPDLSSSYPQILDNISSSFLNNMLVGNIDPEMFHQPNLHAYDGTHTLLGDLVDATFDKYNSLMTLPVVTMSEERIGQKMAARAQYNAAHVTATLIPHQRIMITAQQAATVPVTGLPGDQAENYGGQPISYVNVNAGETVTLPVP